ncbi:hypothetical protein [Paenibacillus sp. MMO-58]|uniref:hypothetical protein n=1 Tax=Paenibacillus sp. MMO-58 TaxID=3081290 RepID=UPI0030172491
MTNKEQFFAKVDEKKAAEKRLNELSAEYDAWIFTGEWTIIDRIEAERKQLLGSIKKQDEILAVMRDMFSREELRAMHTEYYSK